MNLTSARTACAASVDMARDVRLLFSAFSSVMKVYSEEVINCRKATLQATIHGRISADAVIDGDSRRGHDCLVDVGCSKHYRVNHGGNESANS